MSKESSEVSDEWARIAGDDPAVLAEAFQRYRSRLRRLVKLRLDRRLQGRVDPSDVLQETYIEIARRGPLQAQRPKMPLFLWLRMMTGQKLLEFHRRHLGTQQRDVRREVTLYTGAMPQASSVSLAAFLLGRNPSPSENARRAELQLKLQEVLNSLDAIDREVLVMRHFEQLTNNETARVLGLSKNAASNRYVRALARLRAVLAEIPGFLD